EAFYQGDIPGRIFFINGGTVDGAIVGYSNANGYSILPAVYDDSPPLPQSYSTGNNYVVSDGTVHVTRTWATPPASLPMTVEVQSTSTPSLNGIYVIDTMAQSRMMAIVLYTQV